jgi:hypothetical protein
LPRLHSRLSRRISADLRIIRGATRRVEEQSGILDRQMKGDGRPAEQLRHLRQATGQITRAANDAVQAYRRVSVALREEAGRTDADATEVERATREVAEARSDMMAALEVASHRYPWSEPWTTSSDAPPAIANGPAVMPPGRVGAEDDA